MSDALMLGIDVGTGSVKGVLADAGGQFFASATESYCYSSPVPNAAEQNPDDWWQALCTVTRELLTRNQAAAARLCALAISGQGVATVVLGDDRRPLRNAMLWMDTRCASIAETLAETHGDRIAAISGKRPAAYNVEPKLLWIQQEEPLVWSKIWKVMTTTAYINLRLTGEAVMNRSDAGILLSYDLLKREWSKDCLRAMKLPANLFCDLVECDAQIGIITAEAALQTGLPAGLPVMGGGEDTSSAGLAMGVMSQDEVQLSTGTACTVYVPFREPVTDSRLLAFPHVLRGLTLMGGSIVSGGISIEWLMKLLGFGGADRDAKTAALSTLTQQATQISAGGDGLIFLPYLAGELQPVNDGHARGVFFGLGLATEPAHLLRAVMEGTAFAIRHNLDVLRELGSSPAKIVAVGGPSRNDLWCQVIADVTALPLHAMEDSAGAAFGDAILAAMGAGIIEEPAAMQQAHARPRHCFLPNPATFARYESAYATYRELYPRLKDLFVRSQQPADTPDPRG